MLNSRAVVRAVDPVMILVTGGAGFIGANFVLDWLAQHGEPVVNLDKLTYAGNLGNLGVARAATRATCSCAATSATARCVGALLAEHRPRAIVNFAAETHVDRSIHGPAEFIETNVVGTFALLECVARILERAARRRARRRSASCTCRPTRSTARSGPTIRRSPRRTPYAPNSPYSASKAASDHLVRAYHHTYGLPTLTTNCSNNYGPHQFPEKLIPLMIVNALAGKPLPVYGDGRNVRDWLYVGDHCSAIRAVLERGRPGETYNIGGNAEMANIDVVHTLCDARSTQRRPRARRRERLITFVTDRPGHDRRYAIDAAEDPARARLDAGARRSSRACAGPSTGISTNERLAAQRRRPASTGDGSTLQLRAARVRG